MNAARTLIPLFSIASSLLLQWFPAIAIGQEFARNYYSSALRGDISATLESMADTTFADRRDELSDKEKKLAAQIASRFVIRNDETELTSENAFVKDVVLTYQEYWRRVLTGKQDTTAGKTFLSKQLAEVLVKHGLASQAVSANIVFDLTGQKIEAAGYQHLGGVTLPYHELMLWKSNDEVQYDVELTDRTQAVKVVFMSGFLVRGWLHYATFGRSGTGGWATRDSLFCLKDDYDLDSEKFRVSYLKHEARHFADFGIFPKLKQADLEYRAKLTELSYADELIPSTIQSFISQSDSAPTSPPHCRASYAAMDQLSRAILEKPLVESESDWDAVSVEVINDTANRLLEEHTERLKQAGASTVEGIIDELINAG